jgi:hypothetical protein
MHVRAGDGREIVARFGSDVEAPQIDADAPGDLRDAVLRLWRQRLPRGRRPAVTTIVDDEQLRVVIREMRRNRDRITQETVATRAGFTVWEVRGYLRIKHQTWAEFLRSF